MVKQKKLEHSASEHMYPPNPSPVVEPSHLAILIWPKMLTKIDIIMQVRK